MRHAAHARPMSRLIHTKYLCVYVENVKFYKFVSRFLPRILYNECVFVKICIPHLRLVSKHTSVVVGTTKDQLIPGSQTPPRVTEPFLRPKGSEIEIRAQPQLEGEY